MARLIVVGGSVGCFRVARLIAIVPYSRVDRRISPIEELSKIWLASGQAIRRSGRQSPVVHASKAKQCMIDCLAMRMRLAINATNNNENEISV